MIFILNSVVKERILLGLADQENIIKYKNFKVGRYQTEKLLSLIDNFLVASKIKINNLTGIIVIIGPGSFTAVRLGVLAANTLSYSLDIPSIGLKAGNENFESLVKQGIKKLENKKGFNSARPFYGRQPNITKAGEKFK